MKIAESVRNHITAIFRHCESVDHGELARLQDHAYSKQTFGLHYPFCLDVSAIAPELSKRYWTMQFLVRGRSVRVTSQWFDSNHSAFRAYLLSKRIEADVDTIAASPSLIAAVSRARSARKSRHRGWAIGNAQNLLIRTILSNLGNETFVEDDWRATKDYFQHRCAYCDSADELVIEHAVPINRRSLGEHRLGNLVPSCKKCNSAKAGRDYREFLGSDRAKVALIEGYMDSRNYVPLGDNAQVRMILDLAYEEIPQISKRYIALLNALLSAGATPSDFDELDGDRFGSDIASQATIGDLDPALSADT